MGTALSRHPSRLAAVVGAVVARGRPLLAFLRQRRKAGRDARALQKLPSHVLADMGLEKMEIRSGPLGGHETWIIPHRFR
jgi:uncharacterized protein YjiS (DUF1127 family)